MEKNPTELRDELQRLSSGISRISELKPEFPDLEDLSKFLFDSYFHVKEYEFRMSQPPPVQRRKPRVLRWVFGEAPAVPPKPTEDDAIISSIANQWEKLRDQLCRACTIHLFDLSNATPENQDLWQWQINGLRSSCYVLGSRAVHFEWSEKTIGRTTSTQLAEITSVCISIEKFAKQFFELDRASIHQIINELETASPLSPDQTSTLRKMAACRNRLVHEYSVVHIDDYKQTLDAAVSVMNSVGLKLNQGFTVDAYSALFEKQLSFVVDSSKLVHALVVEKCSQCLPEFGVEVEGIASIIPDKDLRHSFFEFSNQRNRLVHSGETMDGKSFCSFQEKTESFVEELQRFNPAECIQKNRIIVMKSIDSGDDEW